LGVQTWSGDSQSTPFPEIPRWHLSPRFL
jgi:hypothetical protein